MCCIINKRNGDSLDALNSFGSGHELEPELGVHHLSEAAGQHVPEEGVLTYEYILVRKSN
jgi:hypothetical protein